MLRNLVKLSLIRKYNQNVSNDIRNLHSTSQRLVKEETETRESKLGNRINDLEAKYTKEQEEQMLKVLNNSKLNELLGYNISKGRANKLLAWRMRNGLLKNLNDIFSVEGFGLKTAENLFQSLLAEPRTNELSLGKGQSRMAAFITPSLEVEQRQTIKSCVSVRIGVNSITWSRLDVPAQYINAPCLLTHWQNHEIAEKKLHLYELIQRCLYVHQLIPTADCYLFESPQMAQASNNQGNVEQQNINIEKAQVTGMMGYALSSRNNQPNYVNDSFKETKYMPNLFYLRRFLAARLFNHLVGTERVSSEETIVNMMRTFYNINEEQEFITSQEDVVSENVQQLNDNGVNLCSRVQFPTELRQMFSKAPRYYREFLSQTLLLNLAFVRLVLLQDAESIAIVSRGNKSKSAVNEV